LLNFCSGLAAVSCPVHLAIGTPRQTAKRTLTLEPEQAGEPDQAEQDDDQQHPSVAREEPEKAVPDRTAPSAAPRTVSRHGILPQWLLVLTGKDSAGCAPPAANLFWARERPPLARRPESQIREGYPPRMRPLPTPGKAAPAKKKAAHEGRPEFRTFC
jgi:hypothetical protein